MSYTPRNPYWMAPLDLLRRPEVLRLRKKYPRAVEYLYAIITVVKESKDSRGRIVNGSRALCAQDLALMNDGDESATPDWEAFLAACVREGLLSETGGTLRLAQPADFIRPPSREPEVEAERKRKARRIEHGAPVRNGPDESENVRIEGKARQGKSREGKGSQEKQLPLHGAEDGADQAPSAPAAAAASSSSQGTNGRGTSLDILRPDVSDRLKRLSLVPGDTRLWNDFAAFARRASSEAHAKPEDLLAALDYGVDATLHEVHHGKKPVRKRWALALTIAEERLQDAIDRRKFRDEQRQLGLPDPKPFRFRAPDTAGAGC